ncbi:MAG: carboxypeptidase regulatory-like domain-containing protein [Candidatus Brocadiaceae bacterium]|nr:carboxypeptidase regulatory-like domain-containing protein [Candidatus Brocadiaceae bacterium]
MKKIFLVTALCLLFCSFTRLITAGDIYGYVYDTNHKGLANVVISIKGGDRVYREKTSANGQYTLSLGEGTHSVIYEKEGYQTKIIDIGLRKNEAKYVEMVIMVIMVPDEIPTNINSD